MNKKILIVKDENNIRKDIMKTLHLSNYETYGASDGADGLEKANKVKPDLIISDIMMPRLDGYELLKELQKNPDTATIPFLFLSAKSERNDVRDGMKLGADDYITKPYDIDELLEAIQTRLRKQEQYELVQHKKFEQLSTSINRSMPHEVRTPLSLILGYSDYLLKKFDSTKPFEAKEMLGDINVAGKRLQRMLENYLFFANLESVSTNSTELSRIKSKRTFFPELVIRDTAFSIAECQGRYKDISYSLSDSGLAIPEDFLTKIVTEAIDNAIKFSDDGSQIEISSEVSDNLYVLKIKDYGRGMTDEQIRSTGAFVQFDRKTYEQQGSGLGIAITKKITDMIGGYCKIESKHGKYTILEIGIPIFAVDLFPLT